MNAGSIAAEQTGSLSGIASIVHDLRNPLATIHGSAEMLVGSRLSQSQIQRLARNMYCASLRMRQLLEECLDRSRWAEKQVEASDVRELITSAIETIAVSAQLQSVQITHIVPRGLVVALDRHRIHRVLVNLLVNALEVMPHGGNIHVSALSHHRSVLIRVRDTGPGITPEIRDRLFQPFATAGKSNGVGLGLAFSRQAVIDHGGKMWAESSPRGGACFAFRLPMTAPENSAESSSSHTDAPFHASVSDLESSTSNSLQNAGLEQVEARPTDAIIKFLLVAAGKQFFAIFIR